MTGRAKWDAWASVGKTYATASDAENRYLELARELGWKEGSGSKVSTTEDGMNKTSKTKEGEESIWDDDDPDAPVKKRSGGGMGNKVSTLVVEDEAERQEGNLHSVVLSGDQKQLEDFLQSHPEIDLDQVDEFVRNNIDYMMHSER